ncbi:Hypothetical predicted protein, partial [Paramuricea clavata]
FTGIRRSLSSNSISRDRAQIAIGEIEMAIISFSKALHITPESEEIRNEDLCWAVHLRKEKNERQKNHESDTKE